MPEVLFSPIYAGRQSEQPDWMTIKLFFLIWTKMLSISHCRIALLPSLRKNHTEVFLKGVGKVKAVCSEVKKKCGGRRKYIACSDLKASPRQILTAYGFRWKIEIFHKDIKSSLGFGDIAAEHFSSVGSHVSLVYCAFLLLNAGLPGIGADGTIPEKQRNVRKILENKQTAGIIHKLTETGGTERYKNELKSALGV